MNAKLFSYSKISASKFVFALFVNPAPILLSYILLKTAEKRWSTSVYLTKEFIILFFPRRTQKGVFSSVYGMALFQKTGRLCRDVLTKMRPTSRLMNKCCLHVFDFSSNTTNLHPLDGKVWEKKGRKNSCCFIQGVSTELTQPISKYAVFLTCVSHT